MPKKQLSEAQKSNLNQHVKFAYDFVFKTDTTLAEKKALLQLFLDEDVQTAHADSPKIKEILFDFFDKYHVSLISNHWLHRLSNEERHYYCRLLGYAINMIDNSLNMPDKSKTNYEFSSILRKFKNAKKH